MMVVGGFVLVLSLVEISDGATTSFPLISHRKQLHRRRLDTSSSNITILDARLFQGIGTHYVDLYIGTPDGQPQTLIVDTGSEWTAFPCLTGCCGQHTDDEFDHDKSQTFLTRSCKEGCGEQQYTTCPSDGRNCAVEMLYSEGSSWSAFEATDQVSLLPDGSSSFPLRFGCQTRTTKLFRTQLADGIAGFDAGPLSFWRQAGVDSFSLCFSSSYDLEDLAGILTLGGYDDRLIAGEELQWAKRGTVGNMKRAFFVFVQDVFFRSDDSTITPLEGFDASTVNRHGILLDSGTTITYFPESQKTAFISAFNKLTGHKWSYNLMLTLEQVQALPTLVVTLKGLNGEAGAQLEMPPLHYFDLSYSEDNMYEPAIDFGDSKAVFGANMLQGHNVYFSEDKIGVALSNCDYEAVVTLQQQQQQEEEQPTPEKAQSIKIEVPEKKDFSSSTHGRRTFLTVMVVLGAVGGALFARNRPRSKQYAMVESSVDIEIELT